jgi:preflagellin peptidase FlaK
LNAFAVADVYRVILALVTLGYASYLDIKTREIPPKLWLVASLLALPATAYEAYVFALHGFLDYVLITIISSAVIVLVLAVMMIKGLIGGADVFALAFLTIDMPWYPYSFGGRAFLPIPLLTLFYATLVGLIWLPIKIASNLRRREFKEHAKELGVGGLKYLRLATSAKAVKVKDYMEMKFWYPLEVFEVKNGKLESKLRTVFSVDEEHEEHQKKLKELVERGLLSEDRLIFVTYGMPFLVYLTVGLILALLLGDIPLRVLFGR